MSEIIENYFNLERPEDYICTARGYDIGRAQLVVHALAHPEIDQDLLIIFYDIKYFECPIDWGGANFTRKDPTEYFKFLVKLGYMEEPSLHGADYYLFEAPLLPFETISQEEITDHRVRILAGSASISEI